MSDDALLELASILERQPKLGSTILRQFGPQTVYRLCKDPIVLSADEMQRAALIDWRSLGKSKNRVELKIGWSNLDVDLHDDLKRVEYLKNGERITEDAAIAIMVLLIGELESATLDRVLPIGSGG